MLKITDIANQLEVTISQIHKYIREKHLKAVKKEGIYYIEIKDYNYFLDNYYNVRHAKKGNKTIATEDELETLSSFVEDMKVGNIDYDLFKQKYSQIRTLIPPIDTFIPLVRNRCIIRDSKNMKYADIANKYKLSEISIKTIVKKSKERE